MKKRILAWMDSPTCATGFATVAKNILKELHNSGLYDIDVVGINHWGQPYKRELFPYDIYPAMSAIAADPRYKDLFGRQIVLDFLGSGLYDIFFVVNDTFLVSSIMEHIEKTWKGLPDDKKFATVYYFPIDGTPKPGWVKDVVSKTNFPVAYTRYAKKECEKIDNSLHHMPYIYHGVDKKTFYPLSKKEAKGFFTDKADHFIVTNVARNQPRKDLHRTFAAYSLFKKMVPKSLLYILAQESDVGGSLIEIAKSYKLEYEKDFRCPKPGTYGANQGYPVEMVNAIYNASDVIVSTTVGEGFGLSTVEAMATKTPICMPRNTSLIEIVGENEERGYLYKSGETINDYICMGANDNNMIRPVANVIDLAEKLKYIYDHREEAQAKAEEAFNWAKTWEEINTQWMPIFERASTRPKKFGYSW